MTQRDRALRIRSDLRSIEAPSIDRNPACIAATTLADIVLSVSAAAAEQKPALSDAGRTQTGRSIISGPLTSQARAFLKDPATLCAYSGYLVSHDRNTIRHARLFSGRTCAAPRA